MKQSVFVAIKFFDTIDVINLISICTHMVVLTYILISFSRSPCLTAPVAFDIKHGYVPSTCLPETVNINGFVHLNRQSLWLSKHIFYPVADSRFVH
jgi:hypothetical protein